MKPEYYAQQWQRLKQSSDADGLESLADRIASTFIDRYFYNDHYERAYVDMLCQMATWFEDPELNQISAKAFFGIIVERLCDDFEELQTETYNRLISQVISNIRVLSEAKELDSQLNRMGLLSEDEIYQRVENNRINPDEKLAKDMNPQKVIILSRVTIGADVAINSVICQRVHRRFPEAQIQVVGNSKLGQMMANTPNTKIHEMGYSRRGGLLERFNVWIDLLQMVEQEVEGLAKHEYLVLDPDSRLTQLGVLPLAPASSYRFFNSRGKASYPMKASIAELTDLWLNAIFDEQETCYPKVWLDESDSAAAASFVARLRQNEEQQFVAINLGFGGNTRKCLTAAFEAELVLRLLQDPQCKVILDMGFGEIETNRTEYILQAAEQAGIATARTDFASMGEVNCATRLIGIECSIGEIACLIEHSDEFVGYDSACQHIAAALEVPACTVFAGTNNVRFIRRWRASGANISEIVFVDTLSRDQHIDIDEVVTRVLEFRSE